MTALHATAEEGASLQANSDLLDRAASFLSGAEEGEQASEFLLVLAFGVLPIAEATRRLATVLQEYVGFEMAILSSPFF